MLQRLAEIECVLRCGQTRSPWAIARADQQAELCRQPYTARNFFLQYSDRVLFGTDLVPEPCTGLHSQFPETEDQCLEHPFDGIFFDEAPTDCNASNAFLPTQFLHYETLTNYVREKAGARISVLIPGTYSCCKEP